jgi:small subunit ribosomal protein S7
MNNIMPVLEVKARRIGGATYQVPDRGKTGQKTGSGSSLADHFLVREARRQWKKDWPASSWMHANNTGASVKKKEDMHKMAEANKAFAHYRF